MHTITEMNITRLNRAENGKNELWGTPQEGGRKEGRNRCEGGEGERREKGDRGWREENISLRVAARPVE